MVIEESRILIHIEVCGVVYIFDDLDDLPNLLIKQLRPLLNGEVVKVSLHQSNGGLPYPQVKKD